MLSAYAGVCLHLFTLLTASEGYREVHAPAGVPSEQGKICSRGDEKGFMKGPGG